MYHLQWTHSLQEDEDKNDITIASYCRSVRAFLYWLQDNEYSPIYELKIPKYQKTIKVTYSDDELKILLECPKPCSSVEYQTWVFINLINATALRLSSALNIKVKDFVKNESCIYIQSTKNNKATPSYLNSQMVSILSKYILQFDLEEDNYLFCTANGNRMANRTMQDNVAAYNRSKDVEKTSIHLFRHTFSKNYYKKTKDIYTLSQILNHSSILVTEQYLRDLGVSIESAVAYNPQAQFGSIKKKSRRGIVK